VAGRARNGIAPIDQDGKAPIWRTRLTTVRGATGRLAITMRSVDEHGTGELLDFLATHRLRLLEDEDDLAKLGRQLGEAQEGRTSEQRAQGSLRLAQASISTLRLGFARAVTTSSVMQGLCPSSRRASTSRRRAASISPTR